MGSLRLTLCAGAVAAAALTPVFTPADARAGDGGVSVTPTPPAPGNDIQVRVQGCAGATGTAASEAFVADARLVGKAGVLLGETRVRSTLEPGTYHVGVTCDGFDDKVRGTFTVVGKKQQEKQRQEQKRKDEKERLRKAEEQRKRQNQQQSRRQQEQKQQKQEQRAEEPRKQPRGQQDDTVVPSAPASPVAPVHAGGGGTARLAAAEARSDGPGTRHAVIGLVLAGVAAVAVVARGVARRGRDGTD
ncbi:hypothetical protein [Streptomyces fructofermentans]|uniref:Carboxypeptidase regulatory-like domain-containing protein n=1 Tax=Streptomyces fructofermentans TaxID=152141 RepID=A0A918U3X8_9ACTN|nr:hypothetical protein [Streptomyces fructofermentans]GGX89539.1 hypothetical protein GCM10010515_65950 [Streptomyces fructofermentans]